MNAVRTPNLGPSATRGPVVRAPRSPRVVAGRPRGSRSTSTRLPLDVQARGIRLLLLVPSLIVRELLPGRLDLLHGLVDVELSGQELREPGVERHAFVVGGLGDPQIKDHVGALEAVADGAEVVLCGALAHPG